MATVVGIGVGVAAAAFFVSPFYISCSISNPKS